MEVREKRQYPAKPYGQSVHEARCRLKDSRSAKIRLLLCEHRSANIYAALDNAETNIWCACASVFGTVWSNAEHTVQLRVLL